MRDIPAVKWLMIVDRKKPAKNNTIKRTTAYFFLTLPEGNGLVGRSILSVFISNRSLDTSPPKYNIIDERIKSMRLGILLVSKLESTM